jgi:hypothetical protein
LPKIQGTNRTVQTSTARLTPPSTAGFGASGRATQQLGKAVAQAGNQIANSFGAVQEKNDQLDTNMKLLEFSMDQDQKQFEAGRSIDGDGRDHINNSLGRYDTESQNVLSQIPEKQRDKAQLSMLRTRERIQNEGQRQQGAHQDTYWTGRGVEHGNNVIKTMITPEALKKDGLNAGRGAISVIDKAIDQMPISAAKKQAMKINARKKAAEEFAQKVDPEQYKRMEAAKGSVQKVLKTSSKLPSNSVGKALGAAAQKHGVSPDVIASITKIESNFNPRAKNPNSSARGLGQFINSTGRQYGLRNDGSDSVQAQSDALARFTKDNINILKRDLKRDPTPGEVYLAHFAGVGRAKAIGRASDKTPISSVLGPKAIKANRSILQGKTVGQVKAWASRKMGASSGPVVSGDVFTDELFSDKNREIVDKRYQKSLDQQLISGLVRGEIELNPYDKESNQKLDKALVNAETANRILNGDDELLQGMSLFAIKQRKAPKPFVEGLMGLARSDDPKNKIKAYTAVDQIYTQSPHAFEQSANGKKLLKEAETYRFLVQDRGFSSEKAIERIELMKDPEFQKGRELREKEAKLEAGKLTSEGLLDDLDIEGWFGSNYDINSFPNAELLLMDQYKKVFVDAFAENGGDTEMAKKTAQKVIAKDYGLSSVTGRTEFMRNPPEKIYPSIGGSHEYITEQLGKDVVDYLGLKQDEFDLNNVMLRADRRTGKEINSGKLPSYNVIYRDDEGVLQRLPGRWAPDMKEAETERNILQKATRKIDIESSYSPYAPHNYIRGKLGLDPTEGPGFLKKYDDDDIEDKIKEIKEDKAKKTAAP